MPFVPKKPRQAHVPVHQRSKRKPQRPFATRSNATAEPEQVSDEPVFADTPANVPSIGAGTPVDTRTPGRRLEMLRGNRDASGPRLSPGQLPTYARSYLAEEMRRITMISGALLAVIVLLTVLLR